MKKSKLTTNPNQNIYERKEINQKLCERGNRNMSSVMTKIVKIDKNHITALLDEFLISEMTVFQGGRRDCKHCHTGLSQMHEVYKSTINNNKSNNNNDDSNSNYNHDNSKKNSNNDNINIFTIKRKDNKEMLRKDYQALINEKLSMIKINQWERVTLKKDLKKSEVEKNESLKKKVMKGRIKCLLTRDEKILSNRMKYLELIVDDMKNSVGGEEMKFKYLLENKGDGKEAGKGGGDERKKGEEGSEGGDEREKFEKGKEGGISGMRKSEESKLKKKPIQMGVDKNNNYHVEIEFPGGVREKREKRGMKKENNDDTYNKNANSNENDMEGGKAKNAKNSKEFFGETNSLRRKNNLVDFINYNFFSMKRIINERKEVVKEDQQEEITEVIREEITGERKEGRKEDKKEEVNIKSNKDRYNERSEESKEELKEEENEERKERSGGRKERNEERKESNEATTRKLTDYLHKSYFIDNIESSPIIKILKSNDIEYYDENYEDDIETEKMSVFKEVEKGGVNEENISKFNGKNIKQKCLKKKENIKKSRDKLLYCNSKILIIDEDEREKVTIDEKTNLNCKIYNEIQRASCEDEMKKEIEEENYEEIEKEIEKSEILWYTIGVRSFLSKELQDPPGLEYLCPMSDRQKLTQLALSIGNNSNEDFDCIAPRFVC